MRYKVARIVLIIFGVFFAVGALNFPAIIKASRGPTDFFIGTLLGHAIFVVLAVFCFVGYKRIGLKATQAKSQISN
jgi:hypothetical protein